MAINTEDDATHIADFLDTFEKITVMLVVRCRHCGKESEVPQDETLLSISRILARLSCCQRTNITHEGP